MSVDLSSLTLVEMIKKALVRLSLIRLKSAPIVLSQGWRGEETNAD
jgi:hypothetical protein